jgi:hypothetical protein
MYVSLKVAKKTGIHYETKKKGKEEKIKSEAMVKSKLASLLPPRPPPQPQPQQLFSAFQSHHASPHPHSHPSPHPHPPLNVPNPANFQQRLNHVSGLHSILQIDSQNHNQLHAINHPSGIGNGIINRSGGPFMNRNMFPSFPNSMAPPSSLVSVVVEDDDEEEEDDDVENFDFDASFTDALFKPHGGVDKPLL